MAHPLWKGHISFGLVNIPVTLHPGDRRSDLSFQLLDGRDLSPIGYRKVSKTSGKEVPADRVVRGFKLDDGRVVVVTDQELKKVAPQRTRRLEIRAFVDVREIAPPYFVRPYYLEPTGSGEKGYVLLRDAMAALKKAAVGFVVLRAKEHLALLLPAGPWLMMNTLRFSSELASPKDAPAPRKSAEQLRIHRKEAELAERLIAGMSEPWKPEQYQDQYRRELLAAIERKAAAGEGKRVAAGGRSGKKDTHVIDIMSLLKRSLVEAGGPKSRRGKTA